MKSVAQMIALNLIVVGLAGGSAGQQKQAKATTPQPKASSPSTFGQSYATLLPEQKRLLDDFVRKIVAIRIDDGSDAGIIPKIAGASPQLPNAEPEAISGDPKAVKDITSFYESWIGRRDPAEAARYVSDVRIIAILC